MKIKMLFETWVKFLAEGIQDKSTLKVIFTAGSAGSGKTTISSFLLDYDKDQAVNTMTQTGLKISNIDMPYTVLLKQIGVDPAKLGSLPKEEFNKINYGPESVREKSRHLTSLALTSYKRQRLGVLVDGTGRDRALITRMKEEFEALGYDCMMIFVGVDLDQALERNRKRKRTLPDGLIASIWKDVNNNLYYYDSLFGDNFVHVKNNVMDMQNLKQAKRKVSSFLQSPVQNPIGQEWLDSQRKMT
jgi:dephospho-CoA kinase